MIVILIITKKVKSLCTSKMTEPLPKIEFLNHNYHSITTSSSVHLAEIIYLLPYVPRVCET